MLDNLAYDDSDAPAIGLVPAGGSLAEIKDHIKIAHSPLLTGPDGSGQYVGAYWSGTEMLLAEDLGSNQEQAIAEFPDLLYERGEV